MGNIPILYQNSLTDASKKWREMKKFWAKEDSTGNWPGLWVEMKKDGLKSGGISVSLTY
jgi:hypothetical protein